MNIKDRTLEAVGTLIEEYKARAVDRGCDVSDLEELYNLWISDREEMFEKHKKNTERKRQFVAEMRKQDPTYSQGKTYKDTYKRLHGKPKKAKIPKDWKPDFGEEENE